MSLFGKLFGTKQLEPEVLIRRKVIEDFSQQLKLIGVTSFKLQVGDKQGKHMDSLFIYSNKQNNPEVEGFLHYSLLKEDTSKNLMSIGFTQIGICENGNKQVKIIPLQQFS